MPAKKRAKKETPTVTTDPLVASPGEQEHGSAIERPGLVPLAPDRAD